MKFYRRTLVVAFLIVATLSAPVPAMASTEGLVMEGYEPAIREAIFKIASTDFEAGLKILGNYIEKFPNNAEGYFFYAAGVQEKIHKLNDLDEVSRFHKYADTCIRICEEHLARNPKDTLAKLYLGAIHGYIGLVNARQRNLVRAFWNGVETKKNLEAAMKERPDLDDIYFGLGMLYYFSSRKSAEEGGLISWIITEFITNGRDMRKDGIAMIERSVNNNAISQDYGKAALMWMNLYDHNYDKAREMAEIIAERFPSDTNARWVLGRVALVKGDCSSAMSHFHMVTRIVEKRNIQLAKYPDLENAIRMSRLCGDIAGQNWGGAEKLSREIGDWLEKDPKVVIEYQDEKNLLAYFKAELERMRKSITYISGMK